MPAGDEGEAVRAEGRADLGRCVFFENYIFGGGVFVWGWMEGWMWMWWRVGCVGLGGGLVSGGNVHGLCLGSVAITEPLTQSQTLNRNQKHTHTRTRTQTGLMKAYASSGVAFTTVDSPLYELSLEQR